MAFRILGINGGIRAGGTTDRALRLALDQLGSNGAQCETFEIGSLPIFDGRTDKEYPPTVAAWRAAVQAADALLVTVPSFHGAMPGGLKNALDFVDEPHVGGKPFAVIGVAGGDAEPGVTDTARVLRHIGGIAAVPDVVVSRAGEHWGKGERPSNVAVAIAIGKVTDDLLMVCGLREEGKLPQP
jgi:NAD(P)H-dependent FMN reductase